MIYLQKNLNNNDDGNDDDNAVDDDGYVTMMMMMMICNGDGDMCDGDENFDEDNDNVINIIIIM